jgi:hypothetical protein
MSPIRLPLLYLGCKGEKVLDTFFDDAISLSRIDADALNGIDLPRRLGRPRVIRLGNDDNTFRAEFVVCLDFYVDVVELRFHIWYRLCAFASWRAIYYHAKALRRKV